MADRKNCEGYSDPTAYEAERNIERQQRLERAESLEIEKKANHLVGALKFACDAAGFEFIGRIHIRHRNSGKEFR